MKKIYLFLSLIAVISSCKNEATESIDNIEVTYVTHNSANVEVTIYPHEKLTSESRLRAEYFKEGNEDSIIKSKDLDFLFNCYSNTKGPALIFIANLEKGSTYHLKVVLDIYDGYNSIRKSLTTKEVTFTTKNTDIFVDNRDGNEYKIAEIEDKVWFLENLRYKVADKSWSISNDNNLIEPFGYLYTYNGAIEAIPEGWRLPTDEDWQELERYLGLTENEIESNDINRGYQIIGKLLEPSTLHWNDIHFSTNETGFTALPAGFYIPNSIPGMPETNVFEKYGEMAMYLTSSLSSDDNDYAYIRQISTSCILRLTMNKNFAYSIRCVKDKF